jgi:hypothetical protein
VVDSGGFGYGNGFGWVLKWGGVFTREGRVGVGPVAGVA